MSAFDPKRTFAERITWNVGRGSQSNWRDARKLYDLAPLLSFVGEEFAKIGRRARERRGAKLRESRMRLGIGENRVHRLVDLVDGLAGRAFGAPKPYHALAS